VADAAIQQLLDEQAIRKVLADYCRAIDRMDMDLLRSVYHPDAIDTGRPTTRIPDSGPVERFIATVAESDSVGLDSSSILLGHTIFEFHGDVALTETYFAAYFRFRRDDGMLQEGHAGRYLDRFERRNGEWRIAHRHVVIDWANTYPRVEGARTERETTGLRSSDDPLYAFLAQHRSA
jgi:ketosteroid isomerase-like protein